MRMHRLVAGLALAALVAAACDNAMESQKDGDPRIGPADGPSLSVGPTSQVVVHCPAKVQTGTGGQCYAFGLDSLGFYASHSVDSWSSSSIPILVVSSSGQLLGQSAGTATVYATIDGVTGSTSVAVRTETDPTVTIDGSPVIKPNVSCAYTAIPSGGTAPFTYTWSITSGSASGSASGPIWTGSSSVANASFVLKVVATDVDGRKASATQSVFVHSMGDCS
ncbi:MAG TPA: hypothetical protein VFR37_15425 [Longimicrobium sp.]|nr:hypothetical protein [Longimicrobium sp.]